MADNKKNTLQNFADGLKHQFNFWFKPTKQMLADRLVRATKKGSLKKMEKLLNSGADVNMAGYHLDGVMLHKSLLWQKSTPLNIACWNMEVEKIDFLLNHGAKSDFRDFEHPLMFGDIQLVRTLASQPNAVNLTRQDTLTQADTGETLLMSVIKDHHCNDKKKAELIATLIDLKANVNARDNQGHTVLISAAAFWGLTQKTEIIRLLIAAGADITSQDNSRMTAADHLKRHYLEMTRLKNEPHNADADTQASFWNELNSCREVAGLFKEHGVTVDLDVPLIASRRAPTPPK